MGNKWFPGHMAKAGRLIAENLKIIDVVIEMLDARIPASSRNPDIKGLLGNKAKILTFNKADLADKSKSLLWEKWYSDAGNHCFFVDSKKGTGVDLIIREIKAVMKGRIADEQARGRIFRPIRIMVTGIPNVGKSSFINRITGRAGAVTGDKPGITRGKQWIRINRDIELLDMPGILAANLSDRESLMKLRITGAIADSETDITETALALIDILRNEYPDKLRSKYKLKLPLAADPAELLEEASFNRGCLLPGGKPDILRMAAAILDDYRSGIIGRITLETPQE